MKKIVWILLIAGVLSACNRNDRPNLAGEGLTTFQLDPGSFDMKETKLTTVQENTLSNVAVLQFNAAGDYVKYQYVGGAVVNNKLALNLTSGSSQTVVFVANVADAAFKTFSGNLAAFRAQTLAVANEAALTAGNTLVMYGEYRGNITAGQTPAAVVMKRAVAKIELSYWVDIPDAADKHIDFTLKSIQLRNVPKVMSYADPAAVYPATTVAFGDYPAEAVATTPTADAKGTKVWYVTENKRGTGTAEIASLKTASALASGGEKATYLEMVGDYTKDGQKVGLTYKLYLGADPIKDYNLKRNTIYKIEVVIKGANVVDMRISLTSGGGSLGVDDDPLENGGGDASIGGDNVANCYMLNPDAKDVDLQIPVRRANEIYQDRICDRYGLLSVNGYYQKDSIPAAAVTGREWVAEVLWQDNSAAMVNITNGTIRTRTDHIKLRPMGVAGNCVIGLRRSSDKAIVWSWHLWITDYEPTTDYAGDLEVGEVHQYTGWMKDNNKFIMDRNLGAMDGGLGTSSWGLLYQWGRKDPFVGASGVGVATTRNWYVSNGSGGFRAATDDDIAKVGVGGNNNIYNAVRNPLTFYTASAAPNDWTSPQNNLLWQDEVKTLFDPCPVGWRVPRKDVWTNMSNTNTLWQAAGGSLVWNIVLAGPAAYPGQGARGAGGILYNAGSNGYHWSSSIPAGSDKAQYMTLNSTDVFPASAFSRVLGFAVRCVTQ